MKLNMHLVKKVLKSVDSCYLVILR